MKEDYLVKRIEAFIGTGRQFKSRAEAARFMGLPATQATKFFDFLDGKNTQYKSVMDWLQKLGAKIIFPGDNLPSVDDTHQNPDFETLKSSYEELHSKYTTLQEKYITLLENQGREDRALSRPSSKHKTVTKEEQNSDGSVPADAVHSSAIKE